jgi:rRNA-processing protein EBP2
MGKKSKKQTFDIADFIQKQDLEEAITLNDIAIDEEVVVDEVEEPVEMNSEDEAELNAYLDTQEPQIKFYKNEKEAMLERLDDIELHTEWIETTAITSKAVEQKDLNDDLKRELSFYEQALSAANEARDNYKKLNIPFSRPDDYFAEMLKTDQHMEKIRIKLLEENKNIQKSEQAKKQRELKKFGKKIQTEKVLERQKQKKDQLEKIKKMRKKGVGEKDDFDIDVVEVCSIYVGNPGQEKL